MTKVIRPTKGLRFEVKDAAQGLVEAVFSRFGVKDHDDDWTDPGAFEDGAEVLISTYGHEIWWGGKPVGKGVIKVTNDAAILQGQFFLDTIEGKDTFLTVKNTGSLQEWSYGYDVLATGEVTEPLRQLGVRRVLSKLKVYEVSPVLLGAGVDTETLTVKGRKGEDPEPVVEPPPPVVAGPTPWMVEFERFQKTRARLAARG